MNFIDFQQHFSKHKMTEVEKIDDKMLAFIASIPLLESKQVMRVLGQQTVEDILVTNQINPSYYSLH